MRTAPLLLALSLLPSGASAEERLHCSQVREWLRYGDVAEEVILSRIRRHDGTVQRSIITCLGELATPRIAEALRAAAEQRDETDDGTNLYDLDLGDPEIARQIGERVARAARLSWPGETAVALIYVDDIYATPDWFYELRDVVTLHILEALPGRTGMASDPRVLGGRATLPLSEEASESLENRGYRLLVVHRRRGVLDPEQLVFTGLYEDSRSGARYEFTVGFDPEEGTTTTAAALLLTEHTLTTEFDPAQPEPGEPVTVAVAAFAPDGDLMTGLVAFELDGTELVIEGVEDRPGYFSFRLPSGHDDDKPHVLTAVLDSGGLIPHELVIPRGSNGAPRMSGTDQARIRGRGRIELDQPWFGLGAGLTAGVSLGGGTGVVTGNETTGDEVSARRAESYSTLGAPLDEFAAGHGLLSGTLSAAARVHIVRAQLDVDLGGFVEGARFQTSWSDGGLQGSIGFGTQISGYVGLGYGFSPVSFSVGWQLGGQVFQGRATADSGADPGEFRLRVPMRIATGPRLTVDLFTDNFVAASSRLPVGLSLDLRVLPWASVPHFALGVRAIAVFGKR